jgi:sterol 3beta-glucosyltransferase
MRIVMLAVGSRGDVQPFVALAEGLRSAGHDAIVATLPLYRELVESRGIPYRKLVDHAEEIYASQTTLQLGESGKNPLAALREARALSDKMWSELAPDTEAACADADAVLFSLLGHAGYSIAEKRGIPAIGLAMAPLSLTSEFPNTFLAEALPPVGPIGNRISHLVGERLIWATVGDQVQRWRQEHLGLPSVGRGGLVRQLRRQQCPIIYGYSPTLLPAPADWGDHLTVSGYWMPAPRSTWEPPEDLERFLASGPAPVFAGFGSWQVTRAQELFANVRDACRNNDQRLVITSEGWLDGVDHQQLDLDENVFVLDNAPHDWLFPKMAAIVHHGGSGASHFALRSGRPSIATPTFADQFFWGTRITELGVGPRSIPRKKITADKLTAALDTALTDPDVQHRAAAIGERISSEDGIATAVSEITRLLDSEQR